MKLLLKEFLPNVWLEKGMHDKVIDLIKSYDICENDTYNCVPIERLDTILQLLYYTVAYEEALKVCDALFNKSNKDFEAEFLDISIKKNFYNIAAKINLKLENYD